MLYPPVFHLNRSLLNTLALSLFLVLVGCDSNPVDVLEEESAANVGQPAERTNTRTVEYAVWSEKEIPVDLEVLMWNPESGTFDHKTIQISEGQYVKSFEVSPKDLDKIDFTVYTKSEVGIVRATITVNDNELVFSTATRDMPLMSLDIRQDTSDL